MSRTTGQTRFLQPRSSSFMGRKNIRERYCAGIREQGNTKSALQRSKGAIREPGAAIGHASCAVCIWSRHLEAKSMGLHQFQQERFNASPAFEQANQQCHLRGGQHFGIIPGCLGHFLGYLPR